MYKIFINDKPFILAPKADIFKAQEGAMILDFNEIKTLKYAIELINSSQVKTLTVTGDVENLWKEFLKHFKQIDAAGGVVKNKENKLLFIFRLGKWDLPKGKVDEGETIEQAATREVEEECGIGKLKITGKLSTTYHTYALKGKDIVKASHWFAMTTSDSSPLKIQTEENITDAVWATPKEIPELLSKAYPSIVEVVEEYLKLQKQNHAFK